MTSLDMSLPFNLFLIVLIAKIQIILIAAILPKATPRLSPPLCQRGSSNFNPLIKQTLVVYNSQFTSHFLTFSLSHFLTFSLV